MKSIWQNDCQIQQPKPLSGDTRCEVLVIGAGMAGLLTAFLLMERGVDVIVIDAKEIAGGVSAYTTAKITSQHRLVYNKLISHFGKEQAQQYANANQNAIENFSRIIEKYNIDCNFEEKDAYVYSLDSAKRLEAEAHAARILGIAAELTDDVALPLPARAALKFAQQAQFHPLKFLNAIASKLTAYPQTCARDIKGHTVYTDNGNIKAEKIVVATHFPFVNTPGYYFMRMHQARSYVIALDGCNDLPEGMFIDEDERGLSFRSYNNLLLLGGAGHRTGQNDSGGCYAMLRTLADKLYPCATEVAHWSAQDCMPIDDVPYIGRYSSNWENVYVATGFKKWGMTGAMAAATLLCDKITDTDNPNAEVFSPQRFRATASMKNLMVDGAQAISGLTAQALSLPREKLDKLENGHGGIVEHEGEKVGVYKDEQGKIFMVSTKCPHLGCQLAWNPDELSWDCPCHGSRFDYKGQILNNPALESIAREEKEEEDD